MMEFCVKSGDGERSEGGEDTLEGAYGGPVKGSIVLGRGAELIRRPNSNQR